MPTILNARDYPGGIEPCCMFYRDAFFEEKHTPYLMDCFRHSSKTGTSLPRFYVMVDNESIVGCFSIVPMDFVSRPDLSPWFAGLFVAEGARGHNYGKQLLEHAATEARRMKIPALYLGTGHDNYYERFGWKRIGPCHDIDGSAGWVYRLETA